MTFQSPITLAAAALALSTAAASAAVIEFRYEGQELTCYDESECFSPGAFVGSVFIDDTLYPLDDVAGSTIELSYILQDDEYGEFLSVEVADEDETYAENFSGNVVDPVSLPAFISLSGVPAFGLFDVIAPSTGSVFLQIGEDLEVSNWFISSGLTGGPDTDFTSGPSGDFTGTAFSTGPGRWTTYVYGVALVPVPLPASGVLALFGLAALRAGRRRDIMQR